MNTTNKMTKQMANKIYDILVGLGGASPNESDRSNFIYHHVKSKDGCTEYRFGGKFGFGGKYRSLTNSVDCYSEDENPYRIELIDKINQELKTLATPSTAKITYLGKDLDVSQEHELFSENEFGFNIQIKYTEDSWYPVKEQRLFNFTEFHWRYTDIFNTEPSDGVAFESDIHCTGCTRKVNVIESVNIELANELHNEPFSK